MAITLVRTVVVYILIMVVMRLMGKRQIGELQPTELVITILLSELVAIPLQDNEYPLLNSVVPVMVLVSIEVINSVISMKSRLFRRASQGNPVMVIRDGVIDQEEIKQLRFTIDDLLSALRQKDVFDLAQVQYAVLETDGQFSVLLKPEYRTITPKDLQVAPGNGSMPCLVIGDGKVIPEALRECGITRKRLSTILRGKSVEEQDVFLMTVDGQENVLLIRKEQAK